MVEGLFPCQSREKSAEGLRGTSSFPAGPGQTLCGESGGKAPQNLIYLRFDNLLA